VSRAVDAIRTRLYDLLAGTYTSGGRYVTGATFTEAKPVSSSASPEWQDVAVDRVFDVAWPDQGDEGDAAQNTFQGPHILTIRGVLRVQYALARPGAFEPPPAGAGGSLGIVEAATKRALADAEQLRWILSHTPVWSGVAISCTVGRAQAAQGDALRVLCSIPLTWLASVSASSAPGWS